MLSLLVAQSKAYLPLYVELGRRVLKVQWPNVLLLQALHGITVASEILGFVFLTHLLLGGTSSLVALSAPLALLAFAFTTSFLAAKLSIKIALRQERLMVDNALRSKGNRTDAISAASRDARHAANVIRQLLRVPSAVGLAALILCALAFINAPTTLAILAILALSMPFMLLLARQSTRSLEEILQNAPLASKERKAFDPHSAQNYYVASPASSKLLISYETLLLSAERSKLVTNMLALFGLIIVLSVALSGGMTLAEALYYVIALRFLMGQVSIAIAAVIAATRFARALSRLEAVLRHT